MKYMDEELKSERSSSLELKKNSSIKEINIEPYLKVLNVITLKRKELRILF